MVVMGQTGINCLHLVPTAKEYHVGEIKSSGSVSLHVDFSDEHYPGDDEIFDAKNDLEHYLLSHPVLKTGTWYVSADIGDGGE